MNEEPKIQTSKGEIYLPTIPNFLLQDTSDECEFQYKHIDLASFSEEDLRKVGQAYTDELIRHSKFRRDYDANEEAEKKRKSGDSDSTCMTFFT